MRYRGTVKWFDDRKGYGFILPPQGVIPPPTALGPDVFVNHRNIDAEGYRTLVDGDEVEYELVHTQKGLASRHVKRVNGKAGSHQNGALAGRGGNLDDIVESSL